MSTPTAFRVFDAAVLELVDEAEHLERGLQAAFTMVICACAQDGEGPSAETIGNFMLSMRVPTARLAAIAGELAQSLREAPAAHVDAGPAAAA